MEGGIGYAQKKMYEYRDQALEILHSFPETVISEYQDFVDRYPESKFLKEAEEYDVLSKNQIKEIKNEQITSSAKQ